MSLSHDVDVSLNDKIKFMSNKFPKGTLIKFFGTKTIVWYAIPVEDERNTVKLSSKLFARPLDIGLVTSDPYERRGDVRITITSLSGSFTLSYRTATWRGLERIDGH